MSLPQTIKDAIFVARGLGIEYLWVDALCVRQGRHDTDKEDREYQLSNMGTIYRQAFLTIIAASGEDANAGLTGIRPGSRQKQRVVEVIPRDESNKLGMALVTTCDHPPVNIGGLTNTENEVESSYWNSRGWTFQERALSRRCLIFTKDQVSWVCDGAVSCEESRYENPDVLEKLDSAMPLHIKFRRQPLLSWKTIDGPLARATFDQNNFWKRYEVATNTFSKRTLDRQGDIHAAFQGVAEAFGRTYGETFHWGHPRSCFEMSLSWGHSHCHKWKVPYLRTENVDDGKTSSKEQVVLPSWSWMSWIGDHYIPRHPKFHNR